MKDYWQNYINGEWVEGVAEKPFGGLPSVSIEAFSH